ncbi:hypothetical protein Agub_g14831 [Astrephomene gubernaculifera]|uniref:PGG domain-containing protein n=1 Tax=Astrephomene gubernaculifera TaxID=47775 RepID=A0AAD3HTR3_9CHLO|nr:hypothetical protein Agub_g14831 [Astrephomene gubernaculifera]
MPAIHPEPNEGPRHDKAAGIVEAAYELVMFFQFAGTAMENIKVLNSVIEDFKCRKMVLNAISSENIARLVKLAFRVYCSKYPVDSQERRYAIQVEEPGMIVDNDYDDRLRVLFDGLSSGILASRGANDIETFKSHQFDIGAHVLRFMDHSFLAGTRQMPLGDIKLELEASELRDSLNICLVAATEKDCHATATCLWGVSDFTANMVHLVAQFGNPRLLELLMGEPISSSAVNKLGPNDRTPLHCALYAWQEQMAQLLLRYDANAFSPDSMGQEPLHVAASRGLRDVSAALLRAGASAHSQDRRGATPLDLASTAFKTFPDMEAETAEAFTSYLQEQTVESALKDKRNTLTQTLESMSWIAILFATATFAVFMQPPQASEYSAWSQHQIWAATKAFWVLTEASFSAALTTVVLVVASSFPTPKFLSVGLVWAILAITSLALVVTILSGFGAFGAGVLIVLGPIPPVVVPLCISGSVLLMAVCYYLLQLRNIFPGWRKVLQPIFWRLLYKQERTHLNVHDDARRIKAARVQQGVLYRNKGILLGPSTEIDLLKRIEERSRVPQIANGGNAA